MANTQQSACCEHEGTLGDDDGASGLTCYCALDAMIDTVRKKYTLRIIAVLGAEGPLRYGDLRARLDVPSDATLSDRLSQLADDGVIVRQSYDEIPPRVEYSLTSTGREFEARLQPLLEWAAANETD